MDQPTHWQRIELTSFGGPEMLRVVEETTLPQPGPGQIRVRVLAAGTGFTDTIIRLGQYPGVKQKPPFTPGFRQGQARYPRQPTGRHSPRNVAVVNLRYRGPSTEDDRDWTKRTP